MFGAWRGTKTSLGSYGGISGAISVVASAIYWIVCLLALLAIYEVSHKQLSAVDTGILTYS